MRIDYIYDEEVVKYFQCYKRGNGTTYTAIEQLVDAFNAGQIDDEGYLKLVKEDDA